MDKVCKVCGATHSTMAETCYDCMNIIRYAQLDSVRLRQCADYLDNKPIEIDSDVLEMQRLIMDRWTFKPPLPFCAFFITFLNNMINKEVENGETST